MRLFLLFSLLWVQGTLLGIHRSRGAIEALIVADLSDDIGCDRDVENIKKSLRVIGKKMGFAVSTTVLKDQNFVAQSVIRELKKPSFSGDKIIVFYYTGHGFNDTKGNSQWPTLSTGKQKLAGSAVVAYLNSQSTRCSIVIFDCCNSAHSSSKIIRTFRSSGGFSLSRHDDLRGFASLLRKTRGTVVMAAAGVGETAEGSSTDGGLFTEALLGSIRMRGSEGGLTWNSIFQETSTEIEHSSSRPQHPLFEMLYN